jgi:hypothetical protein
MENEIVWEDHEDANEEQIAELEADIIRGKAMLARLSESSDLLF